MKHISTAFCAALFLAGCAGGGQPDDSNLKQACLNATVQAIEMDVQRYQAWLKQATDPKKKAEYEGALVQLAGEKRKYRSMAPGDYELPEKLSLSGRYEGHACMPFVHLVIALLL